MSSNSTNVISTWIYLDSPEEATFFPQVGTLSSDPKAQAKYWRCVYIFFKLSCHYNPQAKHILFTNYDKDDLCVDGVEILKELKKINVETVVLPFTYRPPKGWFGQFGNQLYEFDCVNWFVKNFRKKDNLLILDSDCLVLKNLDFVFDRLKEFPALTLSTDFKDASADTVIDGISLAQMKDLFIEYDSKNKRILKDKDVYYSCGELLCCTYDFCKKISNGFDDLYAFNKERFFKDSSAVKLNEEAHFFSYFYNTAGLPYDTAKDITKRMWTDKSYTTVTDGDENFPVWHVLNGKGCYSKIMNNIDQILLWPVEKQKEYLGEIFLWKPVRLNKNKPYQIMMWIIRFPGRCFRFAKRKLFAR
ncbi:MAG: hypothetical protein MJ169_01860 [Treponema sp.]|nr:hypothetical protein [Treponema sp.]